MPAPDAHPRPRVPASRLCRGERDPGEQVVIDRWSPRIGERADEGLFANDPGHLVADRSETVEIGLLGAMGFHRVPLRVSERPHVDDRAQPIGGPTLRLHRKRLLIRGEIGHELGQPIHELSDNDESVATLHLDRLTELRPDARDAGKLDRAEGALSRGDVIRMTVAAVRSPGDHDVGAHLAQPGDDLTEQGFLGRRGQPAIRESKAADRREAEAARGLLELALPGRTKLTALHQRRAGGTGRALLAARQAETVTLHALAGVSQERAANSKGLIVRMREDRREAQ